MPDLLIASRVAPDGPGGLAHYERGLAIALERFTGSVPWLCASEGPNPNGGVILLNSMVREPKSLWMSLASRRVLHPFLESLIRDAHRNALRTLIPAKPRVVHFIGTGWDFTGFAMADLAKRTGARFTIWPAIHPGQWGDDRIDVRLYRKADVVFCQSQNEIRHLTSLGIDPQKLVLCGLPPMCRPDGDSHRLRAARALGNRPVVLFVGRRDEGKGLLSGRTILSQVES